jgi:hypothetical protein
MANERRSQYKGCSITTRWAESELPDDDISKRFTASFSVDSPDADDSAWQQFPEQQFSTPVRAAENALNAARNLIDRRISGQPFSRTRKTDEGRR